AAWAGPADLFPEKVKDFGTTPRGPVLVHYFRFTNTTNQVLTIGQPRVSCGCTSAAVTANHVAPGESAAVVAYMDTRRIPTPYVTKSVTIYVPFTTANSIEEVSLRVQTVCRDDLMMSPDTLAFGTVKAGQGAKVSTKVTFTSDPNWQVTEATSTGAYVKVECKQESRNGSIVTYEVTATLEKECPAGNWISDINLKTSNTAVAQLRIPVTVNITPTVAVSPDTVQLGEVNIGASVEKQVVIQSGTPFKILEVKGNDEQLGIKVDSQEAKAVHTITVSANPKLAGAFSRSLEIVTDNAEQPKVIVPVVAKVVRP
ncbi:MAG TPA: DUF1573 domain-containing protein, partial [Gemmataceae bacterium]|nr:DUF1573 domain-containing protein [Gemmataceae bacterium]